MTARYPVHHTTVVIILHVLFSVICANERNTNLVCIGYDKEEGYNECMSQTNVNCNISSLAVLPQVLQKQKRPCYIHFCTTYIELLGSIRFHQLNNATFIGNQYKTMLKCGNKGGLHFTESEIVHLENLIFDQCGTLHDSTSVNVTNNNSTLLFFSTIYVFNSTDFSMNNVTIRNSNGLGLTFF